MDRGPGSGLTAVPREKRVQCASAAGLHRIAYLEWGDPANAEVLVCVHGLTRCARDFDNLARALCGRYRVVCVDVAGRGDSDWLADPMLYGFPQYVADMVTLIARFDVERVHWVGTSMGGLIGMALASLKHSPIAKLVLNEAGAVVAHAAIDASASTSARRPFSFHRSGRAGGARGVRALRPAHRCRVALSHRGGAEGRIPMAAGASTTTRRSPSPTASRCRRATSSCGRCGTR